MKYVVTMRRDIKEPDCVIVSVSSFRAVIIAGEHSKPSLYWYDRDLLIWGIK